MDDALAAYFSKSDDPELASHHAALLTAARAAKADGELDSYFEAKPAEVEAPNEAAEVADGDKE